MKQKILNHKNWVDLNKKYKIGLIAPSSKPLKIKKIRKLLKGEGHSLICPDDLISKKGGPYHSNSEEYRFKHLLSLLNSNEENLIIWSICGGYGAAKIVDYLKRIPKPQIEKTLIGYSDITALHLFFSQNWGWKTIHGSVFNDIVSEKKNKQNILKILKIILQKEYINRIEYLEPVNECASNFREKISANIIGGNLALCSYSIGTVWEIDTNDKIVFLEDVGEKGYQIDRMLLHLKQSGKFENVKAVIFGVFSGSDRYRDHSIRQFVNQYSNIPCFKTNKIGHEYFNYPIIYNMNTKIYFNNQRKKFTLAQ